MTSIGDRGTRAGGLFSRVARHLTHQLELVVRATGATVEVLMDPDSIEWSETEGGGRAVKRKTVYSTVQDALDVGELVTVDGLRWAVVEADRERLYGRVMGDVYTLERLFGG